MAITTGQLETICKYINSEYGHDTEVIIQTYDENGSLKNGDYALDFGIAKNGRLYLKNKRETLS